MRRQLLSVLATLLLLQWGTAYGHCRLLQLASTQLSGWVICTQHEVDVEQAPAAPEPAMHADWDCASCHHLPFLDPVPTPTPSVLAIVWHPAAPARTIVVATLGARAPPPPARGPPHQA